MIRTATMMSTVVLGLAVVDAVAPVPSRTDVKLAELEQRFQALEGEPIVQAKDASSAFEYCNSFNNGKPLGPEGQLVCLYTRALTNEDNCVARCMVRIAKLADAWHTVEPTHRVLARDPCHHARSHGVRVHGPWRVRVTIAGTLHLLPVEFASASGYLFGRSGLLLPAYINCQWSTHKCR